ncbi:MAG: hypothetical protein QOH09_3061, partial [Pseudonocardiales bacterium]|nr:hypothetical protein [Pseudonocardiales bacterium]
GACDFVDLRSLTYVVRKNSQPGRIKRYSPIMSSIMIGYAPRLTPCPLTSPRILSDVLHG